MKPTVRANNRPVVVTCDAMLGAEVDLVALIESDLDGYAGLDLVGDPEWMRPAAYALERIARDSRMEISGPHTSPQVCDEWDWRLEWTQADYERLLREHPHLALSDEQLRQSAKRRDRTPGPLDVPLPGTWGP